MFSEEQLLREQFPSLPSLYYGFKDEFSTELQTLKFSTALADCFREFLCIRKCMFDARDRWETAKLDCRYVEFVSACLKLTVAKPSGAIRLPCDDHYAGFIQTASWWMELNDLVNSLTGIYRKVYLERLRWCENHLAIRLMHLPRINTRATASEREAESHRNELVARMKERGMRPEQLKRLEMQ